MVGHSICKCVYMVGFCFSVRGFYSSGWVLVFLLLLLCLSLIIFLVCYSFSAEWFNATVMTAITMMQNIETFWEKKNCTHLRLGDWSSGGEMKLFYKKESMKSNSWLTSCYFMTHFQCPWAPYLPFFLFLIDQMTQISNQGSRRLVCISFCCVGQKCSCGQ